MKRSALIFTAAALCFGGGFSLGKRQPSVPPSAVGQAPLGSTEVTASTLDQLLSLDFQDAKLALPGNLSSEEKLVLVRDLAHNHAPTSAAIALRSALLASLAKEDPRAIFSLFREKILGHDEREFLMEATSLLAKSDLQATAQLIKGLPGDWPQDRAWISLAETMAKTDPKGAVASAERAGKFTGQFLSQAFYIWNRDSPGEATAYAFENLSMWDLHHNQHWSQSDWLARDPASYSEWIGNLKVTEARKDKMFRENLRVTMQRWAELPETTKEHLTKIATELGESEPILRAQLGDLAKTDPESAMKQAQELFGHPRERQAAIKTVIDEALQHLPERALDLAMASPSRQLRHETFLSHGKTQAERDPRGTWEWAKNLPDPVARAGGLEGVLPLWLDTDFDSAFKAISASPELIAENSGLAEALINQIVLAGIGHPHRPALRDFWRSLPAKTQSRYRDALEERLGEIPADFGP